MPTVPVGECRNVRSVRSFGGPAGFLSPRYVPDAFHRRDGDIGTAVDRCAPVASWSLIQNDDGYVLLRQRMRSDAIPTALRVGEPVDVAGLGGYRSSEGGVERLVWADGELVAMLEGDALPFEELLRIAESSSLLPAP